MSSQLYAARRRALLESMGAEGGVALVPAAHPVARNLDIEHPYRESSDFYYLTGLEEPGALLALAPGRPEGEFVLWVRPRDPAMERWLGPRPGPEGACEVYGADEAHPLDELDERLAELLAGADTLWHAFGVDTELDRRVIDLLARFRRQSKEPNRGPIAVRDITVPLHDLRLRKGPEEIAGLRRAIDLTDRAVRVAMRCAVPGTTEYAVRAALEASMIGEGAARLSFESIVAAGANATVLHYPAGRAPIENGQLVLIDAGAEVDYLAGDLSRTFPANGRFTPAQRDVYQVVEDALVAATAACAPGVVYNDLHEGAVARLTQGMVDLGLLEGPAEDRIADESYRQFFPHRLGHYLGMDAHDVGRYRDRDGWRRLEEGIVVTIEPGLYIPADAENVPEELRGIGVRIEDDVLITATGHENLSAALPRTVDDIEALLQDLRS